MNLLTDLDPPAFEIHNTNGSSNVVLICDHAAYRVPSRLGTLGLTEDQLMTHIGWDPGAAEVALLLSSMLDAPLLMSGYSRLVIDCNRPLQSSESIVSESAGIIVPGNRAVTDEERSKRIESLFKPYHHAIDELLNTRVDRPAVILSIHSFSADLNDKLRPWHIGISARHNSKLAQLIIAELSRDASIKVGDNQPYEIEDDVDYSLPFHAESRCLPYVMIEIRQDGLRNSNDISNWANRLSTCYQQIESAVFNH